MSENPTKPIDVTTTIVAVPGMADVYRRTLSSFRENLIGFPWGTLYINLDGVGGAPDPDAYQTVLAVAGDFFPSISPHPGPGNFAAACKWCFAQPQSRFALSLEPDWLLTEPIEIEDMIKVMGSQSVLNLRAHPFSMQTRRCYLSPALWRTAMMHAVSEQMNDQDNPEIQLWRITDAEQCGRYWPPRIVLKDIGRDWLAQSGFKKNVEVQRGVNPFVRWERR